MSPISRGFFYPRVDRLDSNKVSFIHSFVRSFVPIYSSFRSREDTGNSLYGTENIVSRQFLKIKMLPWSKCNCSLVNYYFKSFPKYSDCKRHLYKLTYRYIFFHKFKGNNTMCSVITPSVARPRCGT